MASRSEKKMITILVLVECTVKMFAQDASKSLAAQCDKVHRRASKCFNLWQSLEPKHIDTLHRHIQDFDRSTFAGRHHDPPIYTSLLLGLVGDALHQVGGERKRALDELHTAIKGLHRYFDRRLDRFGEYCQAHQYLQRWQEITF